MTTVETYRIIKRTHSFVHDDRSQDTLMPHTKRQKTQGERSARTRERLFASRTASIRRADSLKSVQAIGDRKACITFPSRAPVIFIYF